MSRSKQERYHKWTQAEIRAAYADWLRTEDTNIAVAIRNGFCSADFMINMFAKYGLETKGVRKRVCKMCGKAFVVQDPRGLYCSRECSVAGCSKKATKRKIMKRSLEKGERFPGFLDIVRINDMKTLDAPSYGKVVAKYGL